MGGWSWQSMGRGEEMGRDSGEPVSNVGEVPGFWRLGEQFVDDGFEVVEAADRCQGRRIGGAEGSAQNSEYQGVADEPKWDEAVVEFASE
jgi:hypothetical protein